jgi:Caspase domain
VSDGTRCALVVANDKYADKKLRRLRAPSADAEQLAKVLSDAEIGGFNVNVSMNEPEHVVRRKLSAFFENRGLDDLLVLHLSCHGVKDDDGRLYFATTDTEMDHLEATAIPSEFVNRQMTRSRSRRILLLLDCCYSGAFATGFLSRAGDQLDIKDRFDGRGRIVLTASSAMEYSFEGDELEGEGKPSVFTSALVRGLASGEADRDRDGWISVGELYDYAYDEVRKTTPSQTPGKWVFDVQGDLFVARSNREPEPEEVTLPLGLLAAVKSPFAHVRAGAVQELASLLDGPDAGIAVAARETLEKLRGDDSRRVADAAARALVDAPADVAEPIAARPEPTLRRPATPALEPRPQPAPPAYVPRLASAGAFALLAAVPIPILDTASARWNVFAVQPVFETLAAVFATAWVVAALRQGRVATSFAAGVLVAVGVLGAVASLGLVKFTHEWIGTFATALALVAFLGSLAILAGGVACLRTSSGGGTAVLDPRPLLMGIIGTGLTIWSLFLHYDGSSSLWSEVPEWGSVEYFFEPAAAVALMILGLALLSSRRRFASALLLAVGGATALHFLGVIVAAWRAIGEPGEVRYAGFVGILGGLIVAAAGADAYRSAKSHSAGAAVTEPV